MNERICFVAGVATPFVAVLAIRAGGHMTQKINAARRTRAQWHGNYERARHAASIMYAPSFYSIRLPCGVFVGWRSTVPPTHEATDYANRMGRLKQQMDDDNNGGHN